MATLAAPRPKKIVYPESDGKPMAESDLHRDLMFDVVGTVKGHVAPIPDAYASGNLLVYYVEGDPRKVLAPDCFVCFGVEKKNRKIYKVWEENDTFPSVVIELTSPTTKRDDLHKKRLIYQDIWKVPEYFLFDPLEEYLNPSLVGFRLVNGVYESIEMIDGKLPCTTLGVTFERDGIWLKIRDVKTGRVIERPDLETAKEAEARAARVQAELDQVQAERDHAQAERDRANAENERLRAELAKLKGPPS